MKIINNVDRSSELNEIINNRKKKLLLIELAPNLSSWLVAENSFADISESSKNQKKRL